MEIILTIIINALIVLGLAYIMKGVWVRSFGTALIVAILIGVINWLIGWLLKTVFDVLTLGVFWALSLNFVTSTLALAVVIKLVDGIVKGFEVKGCFTAILMAALYALAGTVLFRIFGM